MQQTINFHEAKHQKFAKLLDDLQIAVFKKRIVEVMPKAEELIRAKYDAMAEHANAFTRKGGAKQEPERTHSSQGRSSHIVKSIVSDDDERLNFKVPNHKTNVHNHSMDVGHSNNNNLSLSVVGLDDIQDGKAGAVVHKDQGIEKLSGGLKRELEAFKMNETRIQ